MVITSKMNNMDINTMSKKVTVTKRQMVLYKMCMFETIDIIDDIVFHLPPKKHIVWVM